MLLFCFVFLPLISVMNCMNDFVVILDGIVCFEGGI